MSGYDFRKGQEVAPQEFQSSQESVTHGHTTNQCTKSVRLGPSPRTRSQPKMNRGQSRPATTNSYGWLADLLIRTTASRGGRLIIGAQIGYGCRRACELSPGCDERQSDWPCDIDCLCSDRLGLDNCWARVPTRPK